MEAVPCPAFHCGSGKEVSTSVKGLKVHTAHCCFAPSRKASGSARRLLQEGKGKCVKRSSVEAVLWGMRTLFLKNLMSLLTVMISLGTQKSPF